jgi:hypothetical protein
MAKALVQLAKRDNMISGFCLKRLENKKSPFFSKGDLSDSLLKYFQLSFNSSLDI